MPFAYDLKFKNGLSIMALHTLTFSLDLADNNNFWKIKIRCTKYNKYKILFLLNPKLLEEIEFVDDHHPYLANHQYQLQLHTLFLQQLDLSKIE